MFRHVAVAIDLEDPAGSAVLMRRAAALAQESGTRIALVHVLPDVPASYTRALPEGWQVEQCEAVQRELEALAARHGCADALDGTYAPTGTIAREINALAARLAVDAILVGAHRMDFGRMVLGTQTSAIVRDAPCDVLVVRAQDTGG